MKKQKTRLGFSNIAQSVEQDTKRCGDCAHARDLHEIGAKGQPFLLRCDHYKEGKISQFLNEPACKYYKAKG